MFVELVSQSQMTIVIIKVISSVVVFIVRSVVVVTVMISFIYIYIAYM